MCVLHIFFFTIIQYDFYIKEKRRILKFSLKKFLYITVYKNKSMSICGEVGFHNPPFLTRLVELVYELNKKKNMKTLQKRKLILLSICTPKTEGFSLNFSRHCAWTL